MLMSDLEKQVLDDILVYSMQRSINFTKVCWWNDNVMLVKRWEDATKYKEVVSKYWASKGIGV